MISWREQLNDLMFQLSELRDRWEHMTNCLYPRKLPLLALELL